MEYLLFFNAIPDRLLSDADAVTVASGLLQLDPRNETATQHLNSAARNILMAQILEQVKDDELSYVWLLGLAERIVPALDSSTRQQIVIDALACLIQDARVVVGEMTTVGENAHFVAWNADVASLIKQVTACIQELGRPTGLGDGFWVAKIAHADSE